ncbi:MAG: hypothetical protein GY754_31530 [bacterium]|nr:hypothetical protein [bacterium]
MNIDSIIQSDIIYHERVALDDSQREHLKYYDSLVQTCDKNINEKNIDEKQELGSGEFVSLLLKNGADVKLRDNSGKNIIKLVNTDSDDFTTIVSLLVESGANKDD